MGREIPEANSTNLRAELGAVVENKQKQKDQKKKTYLNYVSGLPGEKKDC